MNQNMQERHYDMLKKAQTLDSLVSYKEIKKQVLREKITRVAAFKEGKIDTGGKTKWKLIEETETALGAKKDDLVSLYGSPISTIILIRNLAKKLGGE